MLRSSLPVADAPWMRHFSKNAIRHGFESALQNQIVTLTFSDDHRRVQAEVESETGSRIYAVSAAIKVDPQGEVWVDGLCGCQVQFNCKHVAAVLFKAEELVPGLFPSPRAKTHPLPPPAPSPTPSRMAQAPQASQALPLPSSLQQWVDQLAKAAKLTATTSEPTAAQQPKLVYVFSLAETKSSQTLLVKPLQLRPSKNGGLGPPRKYDLYNATGSRPPPFLLPTDILIARGLKVTYRNYTGTYSLPDHASFELLEQIVKTGRAHWDSLASPPLRLGPPRPGEAVWRVDEDGSQLPDVTVTPPATRVLSLPSLCYYDKSESVVGAIEVNLPPAMASVWMKAPRLPANRAHDLNHTLRNLLPTAAFPEAKALPVEDRSGLKPTPCLRLSTERFQWWEIDWDFRTSGVEGFPIHVARINFDYDGTRVQESASHPTIEECKDGRILRIQRDLAAESAVLASLHRYGLVPTETVFSKPNDRRISGTWTLASIEDEEAWFKFSTQTLSKMRKEGWNLEYADNFSFHIAEPGEWYAEVAPESRNEWFTVELGVKVGQENINLLPVLMAVLRSQGDKYSPKKLARLPADKLIAIPLNDGRVLPFPAGRLRDIVSTLIELHDAEALNRNGRLSMPKLRAAQIAGLNGGGEWRWLGGDDLKDLGRRLKDFKGIQPAAPPEGFNASLRPYQQEGLNWLQFLRDYNLSGILADDMGLGKTVQALAHILIEKVSGRLDRPCLVVAPTSLMTNWRQETERFAPGLRVLVSHGGERKQHLDTLAHFDLVITSYSLLTRDQETLLATPFHLVILDEAQYIKNPKTQWAQIACQFETRHRLCMTGTPMENHLGELWSLFHFLLPGYLGDEVRFRGLFRNPIEKNNNHDRREALAHRVGPFILRRRKEQVIKELPPKTEILQNVELTEPQRDLYESIRLAMHTKVKAEIERKGLSRSHIIILDALLKLRQVCCDPRLLPFEAAKKIRGSAKLDLLMDLLPEMIAEGRRILLFSQFTSMLALIEPELAKAKIPWVKLIGATTNRAVPIQAFQRGDVPLFLISLKAGGTGLNLTAADTVIHYDPWWNPAVENQATDRAHRIGQNKKVFVYKLMTVGTVEEKIVAMQSRKRELVEGLLNEERADKLQLSAEDLDVLFAPLAHGK